MKHIKTFNLFESVNEAFSEAALEKFLEKFPDDAKSWAQATDELPDMYVWITEYVNEQTGTNKLEPVGKTNCKTPAQWNTKYKAAIRNGITHLSSEGKKSFHERFKHWIDGN